MAKNRLVDRAKAAAQRSAVESPTESHQRRYQADLSHEIGPKTFGRPLRDEEDRSTLLSIMTQPAMILILGIITFALTFIVLMWREGRLDNLFPPAPTQAARDPKAWMLGRNAEAIDYFNRALAEHPSDHVARQELSVLLAKQETTKEPGKP